MTLPRSEWESGLELPFIQALFKKLLQKKTPHHLCLVSEPCLTGTLVRHAPTGSLCDTADGCMPYITFFFFFFSFMWVLFFVTANRCFPCHLCLGHLSEPSRRQNEPLHCLQSRFFFEGDWGLSGDFYTPDLHPCPRCPAASSWALIPHKQEANINNLHKHDLDKNEGEWNRENNHKWCVLCPLLVFLL